MRCISLWQPWGSLWLSGVKIHETRHWHIKRQWPDWKPGDRMAVHAAKKFEKDHDGEFAAILRQQFGAEWYRNMPTGALIGTIGVIACVPTESVYPMDKFLEDMMPRDRHNYLCGDFFEGRFAWEGSVPHLFAEPIPYRGAQGIFNVDDAILPVRQAA